MTTIHDVAKRAGVASITASRVISGSGYASQEVRERVEKAAAELGYVPNSLARSLRSRRTHTLALIVTDITNPYFTTLARGVEDAASRAGFNVIFCNSDESIEKENNYIHLLLQKQVDGFLLVPAQGNSHSLEAIRSRGTPLVVLDRRVPGEALDTVRCDSEDGAYRLTRLLLELGHRHMAVLSGPRGVSTADDRVAGFRRAVSEARVDLVEEAILRGDLTLESGAEMARAALALSPRPSALLAGNNFITIGAMKALQEAGLNVPEEIALVGYDDLPPAMVAFPFFTVVSQPAYVMGCRAAELLLERLDTPGAAREIVLPAEIIVRRSSGESIL